MNRGKQPIVGDGKLSSPLLTALSDAAARFTGIRFIIIVPHGDGWEQINPGGQSARPEFCKLIQGTADGEKQCRMCHILMSIAACSSSLTEQRCHTGVSVLVSPVSSNDNVRLAVLSSCLFLPGIKKQAWKETEERGRRLGLDISKLEKAFNELPELTGEKLELARSIMHIAGEAVMEIRARVQMEEQLNETRNAGKAATGIQGAMQHELRQAMLLSRNGISVREKNRKKRSQAPVIVQITADLVRKKSNMPFTVADISAAARMTPNHFSTLFHKHMGQNFSAFLTDARIAAAKELLRDLTMNVGEVALKAGFDDPGYFTRRFRQKTGKTPREWRESL